MHNYEDKHPTRPGFEPSISEFRRWAWGSTLEVIIWRLKTVPAVKGLECIIDVDSYHRYSKQKVLTKPFRNWIEKNLWFPCTVYTKICQRSRGWPFNHQIIQSEFSPTWSCVSLTRSTTSSEWKLFRFDKMDVNYFQILLIADHWVSKSCLQGNGSENDQTDVLNPLEMKWNESGFRPPLCTYRLNWARRTSWGWWDEWDDTVLQTQDSKFEPWRSRRLPTILTFTRGTIILHLISNTLGF